MRLAALLAIAAAALAACGSAPGDRLPPPAGAAHVTARLTGGRSVVLLGRERALELRDAAGHRAGRAPAGVGPTHLACVDHRAPTAWCYVTDTRGDALLVFAVRGGAIEARRRLYLPGGPGAITVDHARRRLLVAIRGGRALAELPAHGRPHVLRTRAPTPRTARP